MQQYPHLSDGPRLCRDCRSPGKCCERMAAPGSGSGFTVRLLPISWLFRETLSHTLSHLHQQISIPRPPGGNWSKMGHNTTNADIKGPLPSEQEAKVTAGQNCIDLSQ